MNRQQKYPDTSTFHYHNANPKNKIAADCVIRALCTAINSPYEVVYRELLEVSLKCGYMLNEKQCYDRYLKSKGWIKHSQPRKDDGTKYTGKEFCERARHYENYIVKIGAHHLSVVIDGKINDIWNCTNNCIGNYWTKG